MVVAVFGLLLTNESAEAATASDGSALALASLVAEHSPLLSAYGEEGDGAYV